MPLVATILAKLLAIQDWYLGRFVDVGLVANASPNSCWSLDIVNASVNPCGQEALGSVPGMGWTSLMDAIVNIVPTIALNAIWTGPFANWTPYIPPTPPTPPP